MKIITLKIDKNHLFASTIYRCVSDLTCRIIFSLEFGSPLRNNERKVARNFPQLSFESGK